MLQVTQFSQIYIHYGKTEIKLKNKIIKQLLNKYKNNYIQQMQTIEGRRNAHNFDYFDDGRYSPRCDCGICSCFGQNTAIIYGYKQVNQIVSYYCENHLEKGQKDAQRSNHQFIKEENMDRELKNQYLMENLDEIEVNKITHKELKCHEYKCEIKEKLKQVSSFYLSCVCSKCSTNETYFTSKLNQNNKEFVCSNCKCTYEIEYKLDNATGLYEYVGCDNPYEVLGTCSSIYDDITRNFCTEIHSDIKITKPIASVQKKSTDTEN